MAEAKRLWQQRHPGLVNERTQVFHSAEARPELLTQPSLVMRMWDNFKQDVVDPMARLGLDPLKGRDLDTQVMALLQRARQAAVQTGRMR